MADILDYTQNTTPALTDALYLVDDPSGVPADNYVLLSSLNSLLMDKYQADDNDGLFVYGFDDRSAEYIKMNVIGTGHGYVTASTALHMVSTTNIIRLHTADDLRIELGDAAGAKKVSFQDSGQVEVAAINSNGEMGLVGAAVAGSALTLNLSTENLEFIDAGSTGATEQDWIQVEVGGVTGYIRVFAAK